LIEKETKATTTQKIETNLVKVELNETKKDLAAKEKALTEKEKMRQRRSIGFHEEQRLRMQIEDELEILQEEHDEAIEKVFFFLNYLFLINPILNFFFFFFFKKSLKQQSLPLRNNSHKKEKEIIKEDKTFIWYLKHSINKKKPTMNKGKLLNILNLKIYF